MQPFLTCNGLHCGTNAAIIWWHDSHHIKECDEAAAEHLQNGGLVWLEPGVRWIAA